MSARHSIANGDPDTTTRPVPTLLGARSGDLDDLNEGSLALAGVFCDHFGQGGAGGRFAPRQLRYAQRPALGLALPASQQWCDVGDLNVYPLNRQKNSEALERQARALANTGAHSLFVSGNYGNTPALFRGSMQGTDHRDRGFVRITRKLDLMAHPRRDAPNGRSAATLEVMESMAPGPACVLFLLSSPDQGWAEANVMRSLALDMLIPSDVSAEFLAHLEQSVQKLRANCGAVYLSVDADALWDPVTGTAWPPLDAALISLAKLPLRAGDLTGFIPGFGMEGRIQASRVSDALRTLAILIAGSAP
jgi:arginase family enzyme